MSAARLITASVLAAVMLVSIGWIGGYAWYYRSDGYRSACEAFVAGCLGLPTEIERVVPRSWQTQEFERIRVWLPQRRDLAVFCERALVRDTPMPAHPRGYELQLRGGRGEISARTWLREDYRFVLERGLRPGFAPDGPRRVLFSAMDVAFERDAYRLQLDDAAGVISFENPHSGRATAECRRFNGHDSPQPVRLIAGFSPRAEGIRLDAVELQIPRLPLRILGLKELCGMELSNGTFDGRLEYREDDSGRGVTLSGACLDVALAEVSAPFVQPPWRGVCSELEVHELTVRNRLPQQLRLRGVIREVAIGDILAPLGLAAVGGTIDLRVRSLHVSQRGIERLAAGGECRRLSLAAISDALGWGRMSGDALVRLDDLTIEGNRLAALDATIRVEDHNPPNWVEGALLREVVRRTLGLTLPPLLPERIEYTQAGIRLEVRDEMLAIYGTHGERGKAILTVRLAGAELALIREIEQSFPLAPWLDEMRARAANMLSARWEQLRAATMPAAPVNAEPGANPDAEPTPTSPAGAASTPTQAKPDTAPAGSASRSGGGG